jgi:hypothetical protein
MWMSSFYRYIAAPLGKQLSLRSSWLLLLLRAAAGCCCGLHRCASSQAAMITWLGSSNSQSV